MTNQKSPEECYRMPLRYYSDNNPFKNYVEYFKLYFRLLLFSLL